MQNTDGKELKPCPFCGNEKVYISIADGINFGYQVYCNKCKASGPEKKYPKNAEKSWNKRT